MTGMINRLELQKSTQPLTNWRAKDGHEYQARIATSYNGYSHPEEPMTGMINRLELQKDTTATHQLESQGQA